MNIRAAWYQAGLTCGRMTFEYLGVNLLLLLNESDGGGLTEGTAGSCDGNGIAPLCGMVKSTHATTAKSKNGT